MLSYKCFVIIIFTYSGHAKIPGIYCTIEMQILDLDLNGFYFISYFLKKVKMSIRAIVAQSIFLLFDLLELIVKEAFSYNYLASNNPLLGLGHPQARRLEECPLGLSTLRSPRLSS